MTEFGSLSRKSRIVAVLGVRRHPGGVEWAAGQHAEVSEPARLNDAAAERPLGGRALRECMAGAPALRRRWRRLDRGARIRGAEREHLEVDAVGGKIANCGVPLRR